MEDCGRVSEQSSGLVSRVINQYVGHGFHCLALFQRQALGQHLISASGLDLGKGSPASIRTRSLTSYPKRRLKR